MKIVKEYKDNNVLIFDYKFDKVRNGDSATDFIIDIINNDNILVKDVKSYEEIGVIHLICEYNDIEYVIGVSYFELIVYIAFPVCMLEQYIKYIQTQLATLELN